MTTTELLFTLQIQPFLLHGFHYCSPQNGLLHNKCWPSLMCLFLSFFYLFFLISDGGLGEADFSSLAGILELYRNATPEAAAAGWMHYLAFDYWVGCWMLRDAQKKAVPHLLIVVPLLCTFMLGPVGIMLYVLFTQTRLAFKK